MNNNTRTITIFILILIFILAYLSPLLADEESFHWQIGEELSYKVKWSFIRLGTIKLLVYDTLTYNSEFVYHVKLFIDSNPLLFFVNMHSVYDSYIDETFRIHLFLSNEKIDNIKYIFQYRFDYQDSTIYVNMTNVEDTTKIINQRMPLEDKILDGTTMIFYARANASFTKHDTVTSFFEAKKGKVALNFKGKRGKIKIDALKSPVESYYVDGVVRMKAIAGLTGPYKGWFAMDKQRPPLKAELKVFIGHVNIELEDWKMWEPKIY